MPNSPKSTPGGAVPDMPGPMPATEKAAATRPPADNGQHRGEPSHPGVPLSPPGIIPESDVRVGTPSAAPPPHEHGQINEGLGELPAGYGDGRLVGLVRDPATLYVYWDFSQQQIEQAFTGLGPGRATLKLWNARGSDLVREAEVHLDARGWYVRELPPGSELRVELWAVGPLGARMLRARGRRLKRLLRRPLWAGMAVGALVQLLTRCSRGGEAEEQGEDLERKAPGSGDEPGLDSRP